MLALDAKTFFSLLGIPLNVAKSLITTRQLEVNDTIGRPSLFSPSEEVIIILTFLRHYPTYLFLTTILQIQHLTTLYRLVQRLLAWLYKYRLPTIQLLPKEERLNQGIHIFFTLYTGATDGCEQEVLRPNNNLFLDSLFHSEKSGNHGINKVIIVSFTPKKIMWISPSYPVYKLYIYI